MTTNRLFITAETVNPASAVEEWLANAPQLRGEKANLCLAELFHQKRPGP